MTEEKNYTRTDNPNDELIYAQKTPYVTPRLRSLGDRDDLIRALFVTVRENMTLEETVTAVQKRCTELLNVVRSFKESNALPGLGWDCSNCKAFNGDLKEKLQACRCCDAPRPK